MRGLAVVVLGAVLIWFGLSRGGGEANAAGGSEGGAGVAGSADGDSALNAGASTVVFPDSGFDRRSTANDRKPLTPYGGAAESEPIAAGGPAEGSVSATEYPVASYEQEPAESYVSDAALPAPASAQPEPTFDARPSEPFAERPRSAPADDGGFQFSGGGVQDDLRLPTLLLEAWISEDSGDLLTYLQSGDGADLPMARRQLCAAFWEALVGKTDAARERIDVIRGAEGVTTSQLGLLNAALDPPGRRAVPRSATSARASSRREPLALAMRMMLLEDEARSLVRDREYGRAAVAWSDLIQYEVNAPWYPHREVILAWGVELEKTQQSHRFAPKGTWPFIEERVQPGDNLVAIRKRVIRRRSDLSLCTGLIAAVNGVTGYVHAGDVLRIPLDPVNVLVDLDARVLLYRHGDEVVRLWQVGIGKAQHDTPIGEFTIGHKIEEPAHTTKQLPYGHPDNPLGSRWLALNRDGRNTSYGIHGTSDPSGVGGEVSLGCIRMRNEEVNEIFEILPQGARVVIQP